MSLAASRPSVSVCFPAYNEETTIQAVLEEAHELLSRSRLDYEILVCNDGSTDNTPAIVNALAARLPHMRAIHHPRNRGIHHTFEHLYREAGKEFVFLNSTDRQWETRILLDMIPLTSDWDIVIASRRRKHYGPARAAISWGFNLTPRLLFGVSTGDAGAVKLVRREIISRFTLVSRSPFSEAERLIRAARAGYQITFHPVETAPRQAGRSRGVNPTLVVDSLRDVWHVWRALRREPLPAARLERSAESPHADRR